MKPIVKFLTEHIFITMAGVAAMFHSVWTLDVFFAGPETDFHLDPFNAIVRKLVAGMIAATIDVGQIVTSNQIKNGQRNKAKYGTFVFSAVSTYLLQFYFMIYHFGNLAMPEGISPMWQGVVKFIINAAIWFVPLILPAQTTWYTFSQQADHAKEDNLENAKRAFMEEITKREEMHLAQLEDLRRQAVATPAVTAGSPMLLSSGNYRMACPECGWEKDGYLDAVSAENGLRSHKPYCKRTRVNVPQA